MWLAFPEPIETSSLLSQSYSINNIYDRKRVEQRDRKGQSFYCKLHGNNTTHQKNECRIIKEIENMGWKKSPTQMKKVNVCEEEVNEAESDMNKNFSSYPSIKKIEIVVAHFTKT